MCVYFEIFIIIMINIIIIVIIIIFSRECLGTMRRIVICVFKEYI